MNWTALCIGSFFSMLPLAVTAQRLDDPTPLDLQAAYCITVYDEQIRAMRNWLPTLNESTVPRQSTLEAEITKRIGTRRRVAGYLVPRIMRIDPFPLAAAHQQGVIDMAEQVSGRDHLATISRCNDAAFLPY